MDHVLLCACTPHRITGCLGEHRCCICFCSVAACCTASSIAPQFCLEAHKVDWSFALLSHAKWLQFCLFEDVARTVREPCKVSISTRHHPKASGDHPQAFGNTRQSGLRWASSSGKICRNTRKVPHRARTVRAPCNNTPFEAHVCHCLCHYLLCTLFPRYTLVGTRYHRLCPFRWKNRVSRLEVRRSRCFSDLDARMRQHKGGAGSDPCSMAILGRAFGVIRSTWVAMPHAHWTE